ncbi:hypothetical protein GOODEAATRI_025467 [Goodea atripinnis]|uniref:Uncharacterized protein n=1 Tax=Goodea atripinnis TaxID=208336 RepID=A0ABV0MLW2_9TELE
MNLPQREGLPSSHGPKCRIVPRSMLCLSTLQQHSPTGEALPHSIPTCQPQSPWLAHFSPDSTHLPPMSRSQKPDSYRVPTLPGNIISGVKYFTKLENRNAYHLVHIREGDERKTAFN